MMSSRTFGLGIGRSNPGMMVIRVREPALLTSTSEIVLVEEFCSLNNET